MTLFVAESLEDWDYESSKDTRFPQALVPLTPMMSANSAPVVPAVYHVSTTPPHESNASCTQVPKVIFV